MKCTASERCYLAEAYGRTVGAVDGVSPGSWGSSRGMDHTARADGRGARPLHDGLLCQRGHPSFQASWPGEEKRNICIQKDTLKSMSFAMPDAVSKI